MYAFLITKQKLIKTMKISQEEKIQQLVTDWTTNPRWEGIEDLIVLKEVARLAGSYKLDYSIARMGAGVFGTVEE